MFIRSAFSCRVKGKAGKSKEHWKTRNIEALVREKGALVKYRQLESTGLLEQ